MRVISFSLSFCEKERVLGVIKAPEVLRHLTFERRLFHVHRTYFKQAYFRACAEVYAEISNVIAFQESELHLKLAISQNLSLDCLLPTTTTEPR